MLTCYAEDKQIAIRDNFRALLEKLLEQKEQITWIIVEPLRDDSIKSFVNIHEEQGYTLFKELKEEIEEKGAYAFCLNELPEMKEWIVEHYGKNWFTLFVSAAPKEEVLKHFSSLSYLESNGKSYLFRFYDPVTFNCWVSGLNTENRGDEALGLFSSIYVESPLPHVLMHYQHVENKLEQKQIDLDKEVDATLNLSTQNYMVSELNNTWNMTQKEFEYLQPVSLNAFKIKLCKNFIVKYNLLEKHTLTDVFITINTEIERATKYGILEKYLLAQFVNIYFEYETFWQRNNDNIERIISNQDTSDIYKMEILLDAVHTSKEKHNG